MWSPKEVPGTIVARCDIGVLYIRFNEEEPGAFYEPENGRGLWSPSALCYSQEVKIRFCISLTLVWLKVSTLEPPNRLLPLAPSHICLFSGRSQKPTALHPASVSVRLQRLFWILSQDDGTKSERWVGNGALLPALSNCCLAAFSCPHPSSSSALGTSAFLSTNQVSKE